MRLFSISPTTVIDLDKVEAIIAEDPVTTNLFIEGRSYQTQIAFSTMKSIVQPNKENAPLAPNVSMKTSTLPPIRSNDDPSVFRTDPAW